MADFTIDIDVKFSNAVGPSCQAGVLYRQIGWTALTNNSFGYYVGVDSTEVQIGYGSNTNTGTDSYTQIATTTLSLSANTTIHIQVVVNGTSHTVYINNSSTPSINILDSTYTAPGNFGVRGFQGTSLSPTTHTFDNLVITPAYTGTWQGSPTSINALGTCGGSTIAWTEINTGNTNTSSIAIQTSIDGGSSYQPCTNGATIPGLTNGTSTVSKNVIVQAVLNSISQPLAPIVRGLYWRVLGAYPGSSGTRSTIPLGNDTAVRADQSGAGTSFDGQSYATVGTGTVAIASNRLTVTNTTGDLYEVLGNRTGTNMEGTHRFALSASTISGGMALRYIDANNYYRFAANTTTLTLLKKRGGSSTTLATFSKTLTINTNYYMRFRIVGGSVSSPALLYGRVWTAGTLEPAVWDITASD